MKKPLYRGEAGRGCARQPRACGGDPLASSGAGTPLLAVDLGRYIDRHAGINGVSPVLSLAWVHIEQMLPRRLLIKLDEHPLRVLRQVFRASIAEA